MSRIAVRTALLIQLLSCGVVCAAVYHDTRGDFPDSDVISVSTEVTGEIVEITLAYAGEQIGMATGAGGMISIDSDRNRQTGEKDSPGFDRRISFNISMFAPNADLEILAGPLTGTTMISGQAAGSWITGRPAVLLSIHLLDNPSRSKIIEESSDSLFLISGDSKRGKADPVKHDANTRQSNPSFRAKAPRNDALKRCVSRGKS